MQIGFQRRFDRGYTAAREVLRSGELGWVHTLRAVTADSSPPPAAYIPTSGGLFRDCSIHDFDILRRLTGREVVSVYATGSNRGEAFFIEGGDIDTCAALLRFDDDTLATVSATRYNGGRPRCATGGALEALYVAEACEPSRANGVPIELETVRARGRQATAGLPLD